MMKYVFFDAGGSSSEDACLVLVAREVEMEIRCNRLTGSSHAIQDAIDALPPEGGTVTVPAGDWLCGPLRLRSRLTLTLEKGARILFEDTARDALAVEDVLVNGSPRKIRLPLVFAQDCEDIYLTGAGVIVGSTGKTPEAAGEPFSPSVLGFFRCKRIGIKGLTIQDAPQYAVYLGECEQAAVRNCRIQSFSPRGGGFAIDSCSGVLIDSCSTGAGADGIRIASTRAVCRDVEVRRCVCDGGRYAVYAGNRGQHGFEKLYVHDCILRNSETGIRIDMPAGGEGILHDVRFESLQVVSMHEEGVLVTAGSQDVTEPEGFALKNIYGSAAADTPVNLTELPAKLLDKILLRNVHVDRVPVLAMES